MTSERRDFSAGAAYSYFSACDQYETDPQPTLLYFPSTYSIDAADNASNDWDACTFRHYNEASLCVPKVSEALASTDYNRSPAWSCEAQDEPTVGSFSVLLHRSDVEASLPLTNSATKNATAESPAQRPVTVVAAPPTISERFILPAWAQPEKPRGRTSVVLGDAVPFWLRKVMRSLKVTTNRNVQPSTLRHACESLLSKPTAVWQLGSVCLPTPAVSEHIQVYGFVLFVDLMHGPGRIYFKLSDRCWATLSAAAGRKHLISSTNTEEERATDGQPVNDLASLYVGWVAANNLQRVKKDGSGRVYATELCKRIECELQRVASTL
ncbi:hypothetical protein BAUCODRAFT_445072 [Baudoinia panamericana UAMH 10762]|uniref:Uncharacterized protein n=1 Tax=Baudoinia panamericana (strain UAMH 10762) TaxID=717646 RepID=M2MKN6_BAUPA|nr:uncharacterized protein BAUCODRAFT_445072 [Baudoinia panamericana UAMH 10762]EMC97256.1 hypothetical protein BAUCODRAFT_445072 [Baudoinia panamericana UAMH 10762]